MQYVRIPKKYVKERNLKYFLKSKALDLGENYILFMRDFYINEIMCKFMRVIKINKESEEDFLRELEKENISLLNIKEFLLFKKLFNKNLKVVNPEKEMLKIKYDSFKDLVKKVTPIFLKENFKYFKIDRKNKEIVLSKEKINQRFKEVSKYLLPFTIMYTYYILLK